MATIDPQRDITPQTVVAALYPQYIARHPGGVFPMHALLFGGVTDSGGGGGQPTGPKWVQRAYDTVDNKFYTWITIGPAPDTAGASYPGNDPAAPAALVIMDRTE